MIWVLWLVVGVGIYGIEGLSGSALVWGSKQWVSEQLKTGSSDEVEAIVLTGKVEQEIEAEVEQIPDCEDLNKDLAILVDFGGRRR